MATASAWHTFPADTDATFRAQGLAISTALQAVATKVPDGDASGQINWTTVTKPIASDTKAGYELYKFTDTLSSSYPVYIRFDYGTGTIGGGTNKTSIWIQVGFAHDAAGALTGYTSTIYQYTVTQNFAVTDYTRSFVSGSTNRLSGRLRASATSGTNQPFDFAVERTHDASGNDTNYGVCVLIGNGATTWKFYLLTYSAGLITSQTDMNILVPIVGHGSAGGVTAIYPVWVSAGPFLCQMFGFVFAFPGNITAGIPFSVTLLGSSKTFMPWTDAQSSGITARGTVTLVACTRWN